LEWINEHGGVKNIVIQYLRLLYTQEYKMSIEGEYPAEGKSRSNG
jgi:hypothetical protein